MNHIHIFPVHNIPVINKGTDLFNIFKGLMEKELLVLQKQDILVIAHTIVSKAEARYKSKQDICLSAHALEIAEANAFDPYQVELALNESKRILRKKRALITQTKSGLICNFSGVDHSNAPADSYVMLPLNSDKSAELLREQFVNYLGFEIAIIIADTEGRPWRRGAVNIALGCAGINAFKHNKGKLDLYGRELQSSTVCQIDQLASAAELLMGQAGEAIPAVIIRGYEYQGGEEKGKDVQRPYEESLFT